MSHKSWRSPLKKFFHENSQIVASCTLGKLEIIILTPNRFKSQTNDTFKLLDYNYNHKQSFVKLKIVARHRFGFYIQFRKKFYHDRCFGYTS